jgi:glycosyltransferase involved in cell wall biosynthesis
MESGVPGHAGEERRRVAAVQTGVPCPLGERQNRSEAMKITIITVCYNSVATLETAIESVLYQTYPNIEYIVIDGGSTDGTVEILRRYAEIGGRRSVAVRSSSRQCLGKCVSENVEGCSDQTIRQSGNHALRQFFWISEPDEGMYDAINKGIRMATGDVVGILNADDFFEDEGVIATVADAFQSEVDAVYADVRFIREEELGKTLRYYSSKLWKPWMLRWGFMPPHPSVYIRRKLFGRLGYYKTDYHIAADYELLIRYLWLAGLRAVYVPRCFVTMRTGGLSTKNWRSNLMLNREIVRGNRENGYLCCLLMMLPKYFFKIFEFVIPRFKN